MAARGLLSERALQCLTSAAMALSLAGAQAAGWEVGCGSLLALTIVAVGCELLLGGQLGALYSTRQAQSCGLAAGLLAVPWALAGLTLQHPASTAAGDTLAASLAASALCAMAVLQRLMRALEAETAAAQQQPSSGEAGEQRKTAGPPPPLRAAGVALLGMAARAANGSGSFSTALLTAIAAAVLFHALLVLLPRTFTIGEAAAVAQGAALAGAASLQQVLGRGPQLKGPQLFVLHLVVGSTAVGALLITLLRLAHAPAAAAAAAPGQQAKQRPNGSTTTSRGNSSSRGTSSTAAAAACKVGAALCAVAAGAAAARPALWALQLALSSPQRQLLCAYWATLLAAALPGMHLLAHSKLPNIIVRKGYHLLALALFLPGALLEPQLLGVALAAAYAALLAVEALRLSGLPGVAPRLHAFMTSFTDGRDSGPLLVTHFTLLLGMAVPIWISPALQVGAAEAAETPHPPPLLHPATLAGVLILGLGDTAASLVGRSFGQHPIVPGSSKTVEGTAAAAAATLAAWAALAPCSRLAFGGAGGWALLAVATGASCLVEALTSQLDNLFVPLHYYALLCLM